jgi:hypothetical protein
VVVIVMTFMMMVISMMYGMTVTVDDHCGHLSDHHNGLDNHVQHDGYHNDDHNHHEHDQHDGVRIGLRDRHNNTSVDMKVDTTGVLDDAQGHRRRVRTRHTATDGT